jgi:hypothetical protein
LKAVKTILEFDDGSGKVGYDFSEVGICVEWGAKWVTMEMCASSNFRGSVIWILIDVVNCYLEIMLVFRG